MRQIGIIGTRIQAKVKSGVQIRLKITRLIKCPNEIETKR